MFTGPQDGVTLEQLMASNGMTDDQLNCEIEEKDTPYLAEHFDNVELYLRVFGLTTAEQANVRRMVHVHDNQIAMAECLSLWRRHNPYTATLRALLEILLSLRKEEIASKACDYYHLKSKLRELAGAKFTNTDYYWIISLIVLFIALNFLYAYYL